MKRFSLIQEEKKCYVCNSENNIHIHEVYFGKNRKKSIEDGCCVYLCGKHHNQSKDGVHYNHDLDLELKKQMELYYLIYYNKSIEDFIKRYGKNYL